MKTVMVTGAAGFFGGVLKRELLEAGYRCISVDICPDEDQHPNLVKERVDIRNSAELNRIFGSERIDGVMHCAAMLAHGSEDHGNLWSSNVDGTRVLAETMRKHGVKQLVFTSSNCLWGEGLRRPIVEDDTPNPIEIYGKSKLEGEKVLREYDDLNSIIIRCPTIMDCGRLGLLSILFEFIDDGRRVWTVGGGGTSISLSTLRILRTPAFWRSIIRNPRSSILGRTMSNRSPKSTNTSSKTRIASRDWAACQERRQSRP